MAEATVDGTAPAGPGPVIAVFDLDNTISRHGTWTPFVLFAAREQPLRLLWLPVLLTAGLAHASGLLSRNRVKALMLRCVLGGRPLTDIRATAARFVDALQRDGLNPGALQRIRHHREAGHRLVLATASFDFLAAQLGERLGFDACVATRAQIEADGRLSGRFDGGNCEDRTKLERVREALGPAVNGARVVAYSDSHRDEPLLAWAQEAVAVNPTRGLRRIAAERGWQVVSW